MKNQFFYFVCLFALSFTFSSCDDVVFSEDEDCSMCSEISSENMTISQGDCMSLCQTCTNPSESPAVQANCFCNYIEVLLDSEGLKWKDLNNEDDITNEDGVIIIFGSDTEIKNHGQCVKALKEYLQEEN